MLKFTFQCPVCEAMIEAEEGARGSYARCAFCESLIIIPMALSLARDMVLGDYLLERRLGAGAMGDVWLASQLSLRRKVALKILSPHIIDDPEFIERFFQEMRMVAKLDHPNVVAAYGSGFSGGVRYLVEEFIDGRDLSTELRMEKAIPERRALEIVRKLAEALGYAWDKFKIVHRDIKPENVMLAASGEPKLMDLGIAKSLADEGSKTKPGVVMGTPGYMSPEQRAGAKDIDFRADIYSLGAVLRHVVTGVHPSSGSEEPSPLSPKPSLSQPCEALICKMTAMRMDERPSSWEEVVSDIDLVLDGKLPSESRQSEEAGPGEAKGPGRLLSGLSIALLVVLAILVGLLILVILAPGLFGGA